MTDKASPWLEGWPERTHGEQGGAAKAGTRRTRFGGAVKADMHRADTWPMPQMQCQGRCVN